MLYRLINYLPERVALRDRWVQAMQRNQVPMRFINGAADPISGRHMVERYRELIPNPDTILLPDVGRYPQTEAPARVLSYYEAFRTSAADFRPPIVVPLTIQNSKPANHPFVLSSTIQNGSY